MTPRRRIGHLDWRDGISTTPANSSNGKDSGGTTSSGAGHPGDAAVVPTAAAAALQPQEHLAAAQVR